MVTIKVKGDVIRVVKVIRESSASPSVISQLHGSVLSSPTMRLPLQGTGSAPARLSIHSSPRHTRNMALDKARQHEARL